MSNLVFVAQFVASKVGLNDLSPTWDIERITRSDGTRSALVTAGATNITIGRRGQYGYLLTGADLTLYAYTATAITTDATVDQKEMAAMADIVLADTIQIAGQAVSAATPVAFPTAVGTSTYAGGAVASVTAPVTAGGGTINSVVGSIGGNVEGKVLGGGSGEFVGDGAQVAAVGGTGLTAQETADAVNNLAPAGASGATGSIRADLDAIRLITDAIDTSAVTVTASNDAGVLTVIQSVTFGATVSGLTISGTWAKVYWSLKENIYDDDSEAIIQLVATNPAAALTDGLLYLDGAAIVTPITYADGTLTVNQAGGTVAIVVTDNATVLLAAASELVWDVKTKDSAGNTVQNTTGTASIVRAVTQTI